MRHTLILIFAVVIGLMPAWAAGEQDGKKSELGNNVEMPFLIAPMSVDGKLLGYAYISSKMVCSSQEAAILVRQKLGFIQDSFVREVNGRSIALAADPKAVDKVQLNARLIAQARRIVGDNKVVSMLFLDVKFNPLRPSQSTVDGGVPPDEAAPHKAEGEGGKAAAGEAKSAKDHGVAGESAQKSRHK